MHFGSSKLAGTRLDEKNRLSSCVKLLLLWLAASDGNVDESELEFASSQFPEGAGTIATSDLLKAIREGDVASLETALRTLAHESRELRSAFLDLAITMSMADREMAIPENHILRFYADALHLGAGNLEKRFQAICGRALEEPGDPGNPAWWAQAGARVTAAAGKSAAVAAEPLALGAAGTGAGTRMTAAQACTVLGIAEGAQQEAIEQAYQKLSRLFHPDRVAPMGEAAASIARRRFEKIQAAYGVLRSPLR